MFKINKLIILVSILFAILSCNFFVETGGMGISNSINESVKKEIFIQQYKPLQNPTKINDTISIFIESAWLEYSWRYEGENAEKAEIEKDSSCQLKIITNKKSLNGFNKNWHVKSLKSLNVYLYEGYLNSLKGDFQNKPKGDTLELKIYNGKISNKSNENLLGNLILVKM